MKRAFLFFFVLMMLPLWALADNDIMIVRDGTMLEVKIEKVNQTQVTFVDLKRKRRGTLNIPTAGVFMIMREKDNNIFFDEQGNQTSSPAVKIDKKDNIIFLNDGKIFPAYNIAIEKERVTYQLKKGKKASRYMSTKEEVFLIRYADGTASLFNSGNTVPQPQNTAPQSLGAASFGAVSAPVNINSNTNTRNFELNSSTTQPASESDTANAATLLATATQETDFFPAKDLAPAQIESIINEKNPYTLFRKGSMAEYAFWQGGKQVKYCLDISYLRQIVVDEKIENGVLVAYIGQEAYNKAHEPKKDMIPSSFKETIFPTEIDTAGTYHLTHNVAEDFFQRLVKRNGYGILIPNDMYEGMQLTSSTINSTHKSGFGKDLYESHSYMDWSVVGQEQITVPAGTFNCVKLTGSIVSRGVISKNIQVTCWLARGVGIVQYERTTKYDKKHGPLVVYLNKLELK